MLKAFRATPLHGAPDGIEGSDLAALEVRYCRDASGVRTSSYTTKPLRQSELEDWAWENGPFAPHPSHMGGMRILFAQAKSKFRETIPTGLLDGKVLEALHLPDCTYASYQQPSGVFSCHTYLEGTSVDSSARLSLVFRTPQKWECSIGGFALSHDFGTGTTTALILGYHFQLDQFRNASSKPPPPLEAFLQQLKDCENLWNHPLVLPCLFLVMHVRLVRTYIMEDLSRQITLLERSIGVTKAGRFQPKYYVAPNVPFQLEGQELFVGDRLQREHAKTLIQSINNLSTWIIFAQRSPQWDVDCVKFLLRLLESSKKLADYRGIPAQTFRETLDYVQNYSEACLEVTQTSESRVKLQLNIVYTSIAQDDGQTSARIATSAGKDSTSMKINALITASYLPATFVAGGGSDDAPEHSVSPDFWIYWAVTIPLTVITIAGWATWWKFEEHRFVRNIQQTTHDESPREGAWGGRTKGRVVKPRSGLVNAGP